MDTLKTIRDLQQVSGFNSRAFIYKQIKIGNLAKPLKIGRSSRWKESDVRDWLGKLCNTTRGYTDLTNATQAAQERRNKS